MATAVANREVAPGRWRLRLPERLPQLSGPVLLGYRAIWVIAALLALVSTTVLAYREEVVDQYRAKAFYSTGLITWGRFADGAHFAPFSPQAHAAGVEKGDVLLRVDGTPAPDNDDALAPLMAGQDGSRVQLTLRSANGLVRNVVLTRSGRYLSDAYAGSGLTWSGRRWTEYVIAAVGSLLNLIAAALLFVRRPKDPVAALLSLGIVLGAIDPVLVGGNSLAAARVALSGIASAMLLLGALFFPDGRLAPRWWPIPASAIIAGQAAGIATYWNAGLSLAAPLLILVSASLAAAAIVGRYRRSASGILRQQTKFAMLGFTTAVVCVAISFAFDQGVQHASGEGTRAWMVLGRDVGSSLASIALAVGLLVALLRYRLYDAETAIGRSAAYGVLTLGFVSLFAGAEKLAEVVGERYFEHSIGIAAGAVGAAAAAAAIVPLHNRVHRWAERRFQKPLIRLREGLPEWLADLRDTAAVEQIADAVMKRVEAGVRSTREAVLLRDGAAWVLAGAHNVAQPAVTDWQAGWTGFDRDAPRDCDRKDPLFPMRVRLCIEAADEPETIGWLLLGPRPDGSFFGKDEREALEHVAPAIARAIHIAQIRSEREGQAEARLTALEKLVARMMTALHSGGPAAAKA